MSVLITRDEWRLLRFIDEHLRTKGYGPSQREMAAAIGVPGLQSVSTMLFWLEKQGWLRRLPGRARAVEVLRSPPASIVAGQPLYAIPGPWDARP